MKRFSRRAMFVMGMLTAVFPLLMTAYLLFFWPQDVSANQTENRIVFGATYMTMNNPYYQVMDIQYAPKSRRTATFSSHATPL